MKGVKDAMKSFDYESAVLLAGEMIKNRPRDPAGYRLRGKALYNSMRGSDKAAFKDFQKAAELGSRDGGVFEYLARVAYDNGDPKLAIKHMNRAIELEPDERDFYKYRASIYHSMHNDKEAEADFNRYVEVSPQKPFGYLVRARFYEGLGEFERALEDYDKVISLSSESGSEGESLERYALGLKGKAMTLRHLKRYKESLEVYTRLLRFKHEADETLRQRGDVYFEMGEYDKAIADYSKVVDLMPDYSGAILLSRANAYEKIGESDKAEADRARAKELKESPAEKHVFDMKM